MPQYSVTIPDRVLAGLRREAAAALPAECCGALVGVCVDARIDVRTMIPLRNDAPDAAHYSIDGGTVLRLERQVAGTGLEVLGFYHSHPAGPARPSDADLELASPGYLYVIVASGGGAVRAWRLLQSAHAFAELAVESWTGPA
jgi:desampylase